METYKKRALTKVRRDFLFKKAEENEEKDVDPSTRYLTSSQVNVIAGDIGLVEINREICLELWYANGHYKIGNFEIEGRSHSRVATLNLKPENSNLCPWEYTVKRLESYGDLSLATWAHRLKTCQNNHTKFMRSYYETFKQNDSEMLKTIHQVMEKARFLCKEVENNHAFYKVRYFANQEAKNLSSISYDERFLKKLGHDSIEEFGKWVLKNGIPTMSEQDAPVNLKYGQLVLDCNVADYESIFQGPEQPSRLVDKNGFKKDVMMQTVFIPEPTEEGIYVNTYYLLIDKSSSIERQDEKACLKLYKQDLEINKTRGSCNLMEEECHS